MALSPTAFIAALMTTLSCGAVYKLSACVSPRLFAAYPKLKDTCEQRNWDSRMPSTIHAMAITLATAYALGVSDVFSRPRLDASDESIMLARSDLTEAALGMSLGYFTADIAVIYSHFPAMGGWEMVSHHIAGTLSLVAALFTGQAHFYTLMLLATEVTTPFINLRWFLEKAHMKDSIWYLANGIAVFLFWLVGRLVLQVYVFAHLWQHRAEVSLITSLGAVLVIAVPPILFALNIFWFTKICKGVWKLLDGGSTSPREIKVDKPALQLHVNGRTTRNGFTGSQLQKRPVVAAVS